MTAHHPDDDDSNSEIDDPSAIILPHIETDAAVIGPHTLGEFLVLLPGIISLLLAGVLFLGGATMLAGIGAAIAVVTGGGGVYVNLTARWHSPPRERARDAVEYLQTRWSLPWGHEETVGAVHGIRDVRPDGVVVCRDGRRAVALRILGTNADQLDALTKSLKASQLGTGVNSDLKNQWVAFLSTSRDASTEAVAERLEDRVLDDDQMSLSLSIDDRRETTTTETGRDGSLTALQQVTLLEESEWLAQEDERWDANDWRDYIEVQVFPHEYDITAAERDAEETRLSEGLRELGNIIDRVSASGFEAFSDDRGAQRTPDDVLDKRIDRVVEAVNSVDGIECVRPTPAEATDLVLEHWTGGGHVTDDDLETLVDPERTPLQDGHTHVERLCSPDGYDVRGPTVRVDDTYARTYWISDWPMVPESMFLRDLHTLEAVDLSVRLIGQPEDKQTLIDTLEVNLAEAKGEELRRDEEMDVSSLTILDDIDAYEQAYHCLEQTNAQPWRLSGYVTVRAETLPALREDCETVKKVLETHPARCVPVGHGTRQKDAFASGAPFAPDVFERSTKTEKSQIALSGAFGRMFPFIRSDIHEPDGIRWGRNTQTGEMLFGDPFQRGSAPHLMTIGKSRSGKTYAVSQAVAEWLLADPDRTLLVCDTQSGFESLTTLLGGDHIVVDSSQGINPFHIRQSAAQYEDANENIYSLKVDEVVEFIAGILRAQDIDPSEYRATIELGVQETYHDHEITPESIPADAEYPTIGDFIETLKNILDAPSDYTYSDHQTEVDIRETRVGELLGKLTSLMDTGKFRHLMDADQPGLSPETRMAYLDLSQFSETSEAEKSIQFHLMLSQVSQLIKQTPGETMFVIDEAHLLFHSEQMLEYLESAAREWARYDAAMWFVSQSPNDFVENADSDDGSDTLREVIREQVSTTQIFYGGKEVRDSTLVAFGLNSSLVRVAQQKLTPGRSNPYSECLLQFDDEEGWFKTRISAPPLLDTLFSYNRKRHGEFVSYVRDQEGDDIAALVEDSHRDSTASTDDTSETDGVSETRATTEAKGQSTTTNGHSPSPTDAEPSDASDATDSQRSTLPIIVDDASTDSDASADDQNPGSAGRNNSTTATDEPTDETEHRPRE
jgi:hypothetical protein